ncbi:GNAT family N-acetyltransferase [Micromonospora sp. SL4-19]|uniref:GNAT family N-acetyltransferase n=1 Tax=Micromonospora sp. SL4-19 TaxID=3399129 RepID=UPI003A4DD4F7
MLDRRLFLHLATWLGQWPAGPGLHVVRSRRRARPAWDGRLRPAIAVGSPGCTILSVPPDRITTVRALAHGRSAEELLATLPAAVGSPEFATQTGLFRWSTAPAPLPDVGEWIPPATPGLPSWLRLFDREVLVVRDADGRYLAGAGIKRHDAHGHELAVGTVPSARGRGLARRLVAQAARRVLDEGAVPTYLHDFGNRASARVAEAAGFPDRGWTSYGVFPP